MKHAQAGQASIEALASIPLLILAALIGLQFVATAYALHLADGAAEAGALALAAGLDAEPAARAALPGWAEKRVEVEIRGRRVEVSVRPYAPTDAIARIVEVHSTAWAGGRGPD